MSYSQNEYINSLSTIKTAHSKSYAQKNRSIMADPRVVTGFKPLTKRSSTLLLSKNQWQSYGISMVMSTRCSQWFWLLFWSST
jgi:hypothetical protein